MAQGLAVQLLFFSLGLGGGLHLGSAQKCASADVCVEAGCAAAVHYESVSGAESVSTTVFVQPESGFKGVSVEVSYPGNTHKKKVWFSLDRCYSNDNKWVQLKVEVMVVEYYSYYLKYKVDIGSCVQICEKEWGSSYNIIENLSVVAYGSSRWKCRSPPATDLAPSVSRQSNTTQCTERQMPDIVHPPSQPAPCNATTTATPTATPLLATLSLTDESPHDTFMYLPSTVVVTVAQVAVVVEIVMMMVVMVVLVPAMRRYSVKAPPCTRSCHTSQEFLARQYEQLVRAFQRPV